MADTWGEYFRGSTEDRALAKLEAERRFQDLQSSRGWKALRAAEPAYSPELGTVFDPRELRMAVMQDALTPEYAPTDFQKDRQAVWSNTVTPAYKAAFETGMRPRDTLIKAMQAAGKEDYSKAAELVARAPLSMVYWPAAAGTPDSPDDWREDARKLGISEGNILAIDLGTDPETWMPIPIPAHAAGRAIPAAKRGLDLMRYGRGVPAHLVDHYGDTVRRLRHAPSVEVVR